MAFDPDFDKVSLLLHMDGVDGSTTFNDRSPTAKAIAASGNAKVSAAQSKWGGASLLLDGSGDYLSAPAHADFVFGVGDFTVELLINTTTAAEKALVDQYEDGNNNSWQLSVKSGRLSWYSGGYVLTGAVAVNDGAWHHVAAVRSAGTLRFFVDGVLEGSVSLGHNFNTNSVLGIGAQVWSRNSAYDFPGYIDDLRITKGLARYTADFTPPTEPFPYAATAPALSAYAAAPTPLGAPATLAASIRQAWSSSQSPLGTPAILAASGETFFARAAAATPLGTPLALAQAVGAARVATAGPLGAGAALGQLVAVARAAASSPLGAPAVMARTMVYAQASAPSPLGVPVVRASVLLQAQGFNSTAFGTPSSAVRLQAAGFCTTSFGTPVSPIQAMPIMVGVSFGTPRSTLHTSIGGGGVPITVLARGWRNSRFGSPTALISLQVQAHGWHGARFGQPVARQTLQAAAIAPATAFGTPAAQQQMRAQARGWQSSRFGTPLLRRQVNAEGFVATRFGTPTAKAMFRAQAHGFRASAFGTPAMAWVVRALPMSPSTRFGRPARTRSTEC